MTTARLVERFPVGTRVEVFLETVSGETWVKGKVETHAHPGVWVALEDGSLWFVTNGTRIRARIDVPPPAAGR